MKIYTFFFPILFLLILPQVAGAFTMDKIINTGAPAITMHSKEFDHLIMDFTLQNNIAGKDALTAITFQSAGNVEDRIDISKLVLWQDKGPVGFQGMGIDKKIGTLNFYYNNYSWYLNNLNIEVPSTGLRLFVSVETGSGATDFRWFQMKIPVSTDYSQNGSFDIGDLGVYFSSQNNGPSDSAMLNVYKQTIRALSIDNIAPKATIISPADGEVLTSVTSYTIKGLVRDQGVSNPLWIKVGIKPKNGTEAWYNAVLKDWQDDEQNWEYVWNNIEEGEYVLRAQSADQAYGQGITEEPINFIVKKEIVSSVPTPATSTPIITLPVIPAPATSNPAVPIEIPSMGTGNLTASQILAQIQELTQALAQLQNQLSQIKGQETPAFSFTRNLQSGSKGDDVKKAQEILINEGVLSAGLNTGYFGSLTKQAVIKFQEKYKAEILIPNGLTKGTGFIGLATRTKLEAISN